MDDALTLFDVLMATKLPARAERTDDRAMLREMPRLRRAAAKVKDAVAVLMDAPVTVLPGLRPAPKKARAARATPWRRR
ncbi:hypothetical protein [Embleya sp. AB8]|uniref:hypothetical protein n=1 Tax=Embleya sp. AB8 TaxID=3156304 RepID=UPI003C72AE1F